MQSNNKQAPDVQIRTEGYKSEEQQMAWFKYIEQTCSPIVAQLLIEAEWSCSHVINRD